jgi:hypothetical protein|tara:strand:- start:771 stop:986 length:216 start_codon:yes stop_codon:yes gene_type:complete
MEKIRQQVAINTDEIKKLSEIEKIRPDMQNYSISKKVHVALQEWIRENLKNTSSNHDTMPLSYSGLLLASA